MYYKQWNPSLLLCQLYQQRCGGQAKEGGWVLTILTSPSVAQQMRRIDTLLLVIIEIHCECGS